jgi:hypothetical protein
MRSGSAGPEGDPPARVRHAVAPQDRPAVGSREPGHFGELGRRNVPHKRQYLAPEHLRVRRWSIGPFPVVACPTALGDLCTSSATGLSAMASVGPGLALTLLERVTGLVTDQEDYRTEFGTRVDPWTALVVPVLRRMGASEVVRRTNPAWRRSVERVIRDGHRPKSQERATTISAASVAYASTRVGPGAPGDELSVLAAFLSVPERAPAPVCACGCGLEVPSPRAKWFSEAHRKRTDRARGRRSS